MQFYGLFSLQQTHNRTASKKTKLILGDVCVDVDFEAQEALNQKVATSPGCYCMFPVFLADPKHLTTQRQQLGKNEK